MPKILTTVLLLFVQTQVFIRINFCTESNAMMLEFSLLPFSNVLVHVLTKYAKSNLVQDWILNPNDFSWCTLMFSRILFWSSMDSHFGGSLLSGPEELHMQDAFKTILPVSHLQPCVLALPQVRSPLILMPVSTFYRGTNINTIVP
jgi:hypothetical protein